jgi:hypothetical protein
MAAKQHKIPMNPIGSLMQSSHAGYALRPLAFITRIVLEQERMLESWTTANLVFGSW